MKKLRIKIKKIFDNYINFTLSNEFKNILIILLVILLFAIFLYCLILTDFTKKLETINADREKDFSEITKENENLKKEYRSIVIENETLEEALSNFLTPNSESEDDSLW